MRSREPPETPRKKAEVNTETHWRSSGDCPKIPGDPLKIHSRPTPDTLENARRALESFEDTQRFTRGIPKTHQRQTGDWWGPRGDAEQFPEDLGVFFGSSPVVFGGSLVGL